MLNKYKLSHKNTILIFNFILVCGKQNLVNINREDLDLPTDNKYLDEDDRLLELARQDRPITREELGLPPAEDDSGLNTYRESIIYTKKDLIFVEVGVVVICILFFIAAFMGCFR